tara:strand:- start:3776 stop:4327 length:552 start_codon:yes stop_codon:yes gene_type:complete
MNVEQMIERAEKLSHEYTNDEPNERNHDREGCYRTCSISGGFAFKLAIRESGIGCNRAEWDFYTMTTDDVRKVLAKPRYISKNGKVIVFDCLTMAIDVGTYGTPERNEFNKQADDCADKLLATVRESHKHGINDLHNHNFGRDDGTGKMVCTDYGALAFAAEANDSGQRVYNRDVLHQMMVSS